MMNYFERLADLMDCDLRELFIRLGATGLILGIVVIVLIFEFQLNVIFWKWALS